MESYIKQITMLPHRIKRKGLWDTIALSCHVSKGVLSYYFNPFAKKQSKLPPPDYEKIRSDLETAGLTIVSYKINIFDFQNWLKEANFPEEYAVSYGEVFIEKILEHYISARLLELNKEDVFIDVAAAHSPWFEIAEKMYGSEAYALDLCFPAGVCGKRIGADATSMPLPNGFATKMALHCAYEMFEGDADIRLLKEADRVLSPGGKMVILPLYMHNFYFIDSSPFTDRRNIDYQGALRVWRDDGYRIRYSRRYSVEIFFRRIVNNLNNLRLKIYYIANQKDIDPVCYLKFAAVFEKI